MYFNCYCFDAGFNSKNQITANKRQKRPSGQDSIYRGRERQGTTMPARVNESKTTGMVLKS